MEGGQQPNIIITSSIILDNYGALLTDVQYITHKMTLCMSPLILITNTTVVITYCRLLTPHKNNIPNWMLFNQSLVDFFIGAQSFMYVVPVPPSEPSYRLYWTIAEGVEGKWDFGTTGTRSRDP